MSRPLMPVRVYDQAFNAELIESINSKYKNFQFGWKSNQKLVDDQSHWNLNISNQERKSTQDLADAHLEKSHPEVFQIWRILQDRYLGLRKLRSVYINGYTYGTDGYIHRDDTLFEERGADSPNLESIIIYLNEAWDLNWAGETVVFGEDNEIVRSVLPKFGRILIFDQQALHAARPLSRICKDLRKVLVFKSLRRDDPLKNKINFLMELTEGRHHSGKLFFEHLINTSEVLRKNNQPQYIQDAGLFHSIYGTESYQFESSLVSRELIKNIIGEKAEDLAWQFSQLKSRTSTLLASCVSEKSSESVWHDLLLIEWANLFDQNKGSKFQMVQQHLIDCGKLAKPT